MSKIFNFLFLVIISSNFTCKAEDEDVLPPVDYRTFTVQLDPQEKHSSEVLVVKKTSNTDVPDGFTKFALFDAVRNAYFKAEFVKLKESKLTSDGNDMSVSYVYDVYTYWKNNNLLLLVFRYYYSEGWSYYKYFKNEKGKWTEFNQAQLEGVQANAQLNLENLTKLLTELATTNEADTKTSEKSGQEEKSGLSTNTKVIVGVVLGFVVLLLLVGLVFFLKR